MNLNFKKVSKRQEAIKNMRILEDTTNKYIAAINRQLYLKKEV